MGADTADFNGQTIGDVVLNIVPGTMERSLVEAQILGLDGHDVRNRGGGKQTLTLTAYKLCGTVALRMKYVETLLKAMGNSLHTLYFHGRDGEPAWMGCAVSAASEEQSEGRYTRFNIIFVRDLYAS